MHQRKYSEEQKRELQKAYQATSKEDFQKHMYQANTWIGLDQDTLARYSTLKWEEWKDPAKYKNHVSQIEALTANADWMVREKERLEARFLEEKIRKEKEDAEVDELYEQSQIDDRRKKARREFDKQLTEIGHILGEKYRESVLHCCREFQLICHDDKLLDEFFVKCGEKTSELVKLFIQSVI